MSAPTLKYITKCRVCPKEFSTSPFDIPIVGQPNSKVITYVTALMKHLQSHPEQMAGFAAALHEAEFTQFVHGFCTYDPNAPEPEDPNIIDATPDGPEDLDSELESSNV